MKNRTLSVLWLLSTLAVVGCQQSTSGSPASNVTQTVTIDANSSTDYIHSWAVSPSTDLDKTRVVSLTATLANPNTNIYYLLTNTSPAGSVTASLGGIGASVAPSGRAAADPRTSPVTGPVRLSLEDVAPGTKSLVPPAQARTAAVSVSASATFTTGTLVTFTDALWQQTSTSVPAAANRHPSTLRKVMSVNGHELNVWVADDCWSIDGSHNALSAPASSVGSQATTVWNPPTHLVTQAMVDALAPKFLTDGTNDIYGYDTTIYGPEWPATGAPAYLGNTMVDSEGNIHIFVANLNPNGTANGVLEGYFHALNNFTGVTGSNQKILFALDADTLADPSPYGTTTAATWSVNDYWPSQLTSTLAHEFQHMIQFYQKQVVHSLSVGTDTWVNEMCSMVTEDLVSEKLKIPGPRGVGTTGSAPDFSTGPASNVYGRLPLFDYNHNLISLTGWGVNVDNSVLDSYANAYAFGAWLLRNYGGVTLFHNIVTSGDTDYMAVVNAVNQSTQTIGNPQTFTSLVRDWGLAVFLKNSSVRTGLVYANSPAATPFSWSYGLNPVTYNVGSIDLGKYELDYIYNGNQYQQVGPYIYTNGISPGALVYPGATYIYNLGAYSGTQVRTLTLPPNVALTVVVGP